MRFLLVVALFFPSLYSVAQSWQAVGPDDFQQISFQGVVGAAIYTDTSGRIYISYIDSASANPVFRRTIIKTKINSVWVQIASISDSSQFSSLTMDQGGTFLYANDTVIAGVKAIRVRKSTGLGWADLGAPYSLGSVSSAYVALKLNNNGDPYVLYSETGTNVYPSMIKWDGANWVSVGSAIINTSFQQPLDFDFDSNDSPFVLCYDALSSNNQIRKFDGTSWSLVSSNIPYMSNGVPRTIKIHEDTIYVVAARTGHWGGTMSYPSSSQIFKFDGNTWTTVASVTSPNLVPQQASTKLIFDSSGNVYLSGGVIWQIQGTSGINTDFTGDLALATSDTLWAVSVSDYHSRKIRVAQRIGNAWTEDYPVSIPPFRGGYFTSYYTYNNQPVHYFFADKYGLPTCFSRFSSPSGDFAQYAGGFWTTVPANVGSIYNIDWQDPYMIARDSQNNYYFLSRRLSTSSSTSFYLHKFDGTSWIQVGNEINTSYSSRYGSFVFDRNNVPYVAFVDNSQFAAGRVRVKKYDGVNWVDASSTMPLVSSSASENPLIACDTANNLSVLYKEGSSLFLKKFDGTNWNNVGSTIDTTISTDFQLAVTEAGDPIVASLSPFNGAMKPTVRKFDGNNWVILGWQGFSNGEARDLNLLIDKDTVYLAYSDRTLKHAIVAKYNGTIFGASGSQFISRDTSSNPMLIKSGNDIYVSYASAGLFVKRLANNIIVPLFTSYNCQAPLAIANNITDTSVTISWTQTPNQNLGYEYILSSGSSPTVHGTTTSNGYAPTNLQPASTYHFYVRELCGIDTSSWDTLSFTTTNTTSISNLVSWRSEISVYPNPFVNRITIGGLLNNDHLILYDITGRVLREWRSASDQEQTFIVEDLSPGYYILKIMSEKRLQTVSLVRR